MEKGVGILSWHGKGVVEIDAAFPVVTVCLVLAWFCLMEVHVVTASGFKQNIGDR